MAGTIKCPVCGENNSSDLDYCQNCNTPLQPLGEPLKPGELPDKKKNTAELEPILPQWLRDAREQSRQTSPQDEPFQGMEQPKSQPSNESASPAAGMDFLAGLQSHANDDSEDETPDWLASITGVSNKPKKPETETSDVRWVEMGGKDDFVQEDTPARDTGSLQTPSWLADIQSQPKTEKDELTDWFKEASTPSTSSSQEPNWLDEPQKNINFGSQSDESALIGDTPDWLRQMQANDAAKDELIQPDKTFSSNEDTPDWLKSMGGGDVLQDQQSSFQSGFDTGNDSPDWLKRMDAGDSAQNTGTDAEQAFSSMEDVPAWLQQPNTQQPDDDAPDWLNSVEAQSKNQSPFSETSFGEPNNGSLTEDAAPDWLKNMQSEEPAPAPLKGTSPLWLRDDSAPDADANVPAWLSSTNPIETESSFTEIKPQESADLGDIPNWLKAAAPQSSIFSEPAPQEDQTFSSDTPDWLSSFKSVEGSQPASPFAADAPVENELPAAAFTENSFEGMGDNSLFNEMPDWLSNATDTSPAAESPVAGNETDSIAAGELPSWVQAMRPVDGGSRSSLPTDQTLESRGALAGLQGVLPSVPGYVPSSKPKAYSILLQASEEQKSQALLLEHILGAEAEPQPIASYAPLAVSRPLRWFLAATIFTLVTVVTVLHTQRFGMPFLSMDTPNEVKGALDVAQNVPEGAPVLIIMDYAPSHAAELEAAAAPMLDQMDLLRHPKLMFVSMNEIGMVLTERMMALPSLKDRYRGEGQLKNLGYLPGGEIGIRSFVLDPSQTFQQDMFRKPTSLQPSISIVQFVAVLLLTDNADSGRVWIEQITAVTAPLPFPAPVVVITSAQAAPMAQPYYVSGQIKGIVSGLYGSAVFEQNNAGRPGTARSYWDAYSAGTWLAMLVLLIGGLWNLALGARDRTAAREGM